MTTPLPPTITDATVTLTYAGVQPGVSAGQYFGYCTVADVKFYFPNLTAYTTLTSSIVGQMVTEAALELQNLIDPIYQMPYTGANGPILLTLRNLNARLATSMLIERYFTGAEPDLSPWAKEYRDYVELLVADLENGKTRWDTPFGDATPRAMMPVYDIASLATIYPNPSVADVSAQQPIFRISRSPYRTDDME